MSARSIDLLGQYISQVLIPRLNRGDELSNHHRYWDAVKSQRSVIRALVRSSDAEEGELKGWLKRIDAVETEAVKVQGETRASTGWKRDAVRNRLARDLYPELDWEIWGWLHGRGYFEARKSFGPDLTKVSPDGAEQM